MVRSVSDSGDEVRLERKGSVAEVVLDRPASKNGLTPETCRALSAILHAVADDPELRVVVLTGAGQAFCSGLDLRAAAAAAVSRGGDAGERERALRQDFHGLTRALWAVPQPTIAGIGGPAVGFGFDLALACDIRIGLRETKYGAVFSRLGLVPDGGGTFTLQRLVGPGKAFELIYTGRTFDGGEAHRLGLLDRVVESHDELTVEVDRLCAELAARPPLALRAAKSAIRAAMAGTLDEALEREAQAQLRLLETEDTLTALMAFVTKTTPTFHGR